MDVSLAAEASSGKVRHHRCAAASPRPQFGWIAARGLFAGHPVHIFTPVKEAS
jgi:hypothetical protein